MPTAFAVRLSVAYGALCEATVSLISYLESKFDSVIIYEHIGAKTEKVHVHMLLFDDKDDLITAEAIKARVEFKALGLHGNEDLSFKTGYKAKGIRYKITRDTVPRYICYMAKGELEPMCVSQNSYWDWKFCLAQIDNWTVIEPTEGEKTYDAFIQYTKQNPHPPTEPETQYKWLQRISLKFCMERHKRATRAMFAERHMLFSTYLYYFHVVIPDGKISPLIL